jgi:hypothetical protein
MDNFSQEQFTTSSFKVKCQSKVYLALAVKGFFNKIAKGKDSLSLYSQKACRL